MARFKSEFMNVAHARGFVHQCTDEAALDAALQKGVVTAYCGYDCTAKSLHVGNLLGIMLLHWLQKCGHRPIILMGGGTTKIGDPSGKDESRKLLTDDEIAGNMAGIKQSFGGLITFGARPRDAIMANNDEWLSKLGCIELLRDVGTHFTINRMLTFDSVKLRLEREQALTFLEFNYMILQAYDFLELKRRYGCTLQTGGSDQWGNIVNGVELCRRIDGDEVFGLTTPLLTTASGAKMGKSAAGAVWLNESLLPAFDFWQYWRNTEDADVGRFLRLFTEEPLDEIARLEKLQGAEINKAKEHLAFKVTELVRGRAAAEAAAQAARAIFSGAGSVDVHADVKGVGLGLPTIEIAKARIAGGIAAFDLLRELGLTKSGGEARRLIQGGGVRLNDAPLTDENRKVVLSDLGDGGSLKLSLGKKRHVLVKVV